MMIDQRNKSKLPELKKTAHLARCLRPAAKPPGFAVKTDTFVKTDNEAAQLSCR